MEQYYKVHSEIDTERDRRYTERDDSRKAAVDAALVAMKEQTNASFLSSEKAITKAEKAQSDYNNRSNEFRGQLDDQAKRLATKDELGSISRNLEEKINRIDRDLRDLREYKSEVSGKESRVREFKDESRANIALIISLIMGFLSFISISITIITLLSADVL